MHYAVHKHTVAELIYRRADHTKANRRIVNAYLDFAEEYAKRRVPLTMEDWAKHLDLIL
jgi:hypothetical protein